MEEKMYQKLMDDYVKQINEATSNLSTEEYVKTMNAITGIVDTIGEYWKSRFLNEKVED